MKKNEEAYGNEPVNIADGIFWVGYADHYRGLHCNPYLIIEGEEAVLIDAGNREDFSTVMLKILRTGLKPSQISRLIYQHYDPDLCGSLPQLEAIISNNALKIISHEENNVFIHYYSSKTEKLDFRDLGDHYDFATGRRLEFYATPFCHQPGSFITYDTKTKVLFSSDLFGSFDAKWSLMLELDDACRECRDFKECPVNNNNIKHCPINGIIEFHQKVMPSNCALKNTLNIIEKLDIEMIAPQHGSIIYKKEDIESVMQHLRSIKNVGIDLLLSEESV